MPRRLPRAPFVIALLASVVSCGDDGTVLPAQTGGDAGGDAAAQGVALQAIAAVEAEVGATTTVTVTASNPDALALTWTASSATLALDAAAVAGSATGATITLTPTDADVGEHDVEVVATWEGGEARGAFTVTVVPAPCFYPGPNGFAIGQAFPDFAWAAQFADSTEITFDLYDFYCDDAEWGAYETLLFVILTDWCPNCPAYMRYVDAFASRLEEEGMLIFYLDVQDRYGARTYTSSSNQHVNKFTPNGSGIRAGDGDNIVRADGVIDSGLVEYFPTSFVVRRSDMTLIADQRDTDYYLPLAEIAMDPDANWSSPPQPTIFPDFPANCDQADEESYEPNNNVDQAAVIDGDITVEGGICDTAPDFYYVDIEGAWTAELDFTNAVGDLDIYVWDVETQRPARDETGSAIGSDGTTDHEEFEYTGPAHVMVYGYDGATATYTLTVTAN